MISLNEKDKRIYNVYNLYVHTWSELRKNKFYAILEKDSDI